MTTATATPKSTSTKPAPPRIKAPEIVPLRTDDDTFIIYTYTAGWRLEVYEPKVICGEDWEPILSPEHLALGANVFRRAEPGSRKKTGYEFLHHDFAGTCLIADKPTPLTDVIKVIPPKP